jgi:hypothetical protein
MMFFVKLNLVLKSGDFKKCIGLTAIKRFFGI